MNVGKTLFAQVMDFVPWKTFTRIIERHKGDAVVCAMSAKIRNRSVAFFFGSTRRATRQSGSIVL